ncbi:radical SAM protein [Prevotella lacticifex]|uniref:Radical SAM core domain-containing protein n=1 Tax=Prevotella lacticifex TaxID=2854755 RepID=A0A9R1CAJ6_9BACT|nr:radical SAM protein [Prevotella lacticifex]GJG35809.1 hypothetical protein PRLR5003_09660 [Prevotella lacticifex]GJG39142.1 hypothetical protein PRLR5019_11130 [Prevotella lacticifex]GJG42178.1 hypothetical protein PRLR5025_09640 [Prevotella lacticifex]GJG45496.1 hypothetical protein PRLR5027_10910 [Prevotella lacticifex]GJG48529.1 hypothetical protein PRLR5052_09420 [Prevotella lacticifex]
MKPEDTEKKWKGKAIYEPSGAAYEYCHWACNLFNGCTNRCDYCYNRHSMTAGILGAEEVSIKKALKDEKTAFSIFCKELKLIKPMMKPTESLFFSFVSDPMLPQNKALTMRCVMEALRNRVNVQILTKCSDWVYDEATIRPLIPYARHIAIGFTITGMDSMESFCINNTAERIKAMGKLKEYGFPTFASVEPVIGIDKAILAARKAYPVCDMFKVGLVSKMGVKFTKEQVMDLVYRMHIFVRDGTAVYWKQSVREIVGNEYCDSWSNSVPSDWSLVQPWEEGGRHE